MRRAITVGTHRVELTHEDKEIYPKSHIIKKEVIEYYYNIADVMLPHVKDRPISMQRFVEGIDHEGFFQKDAGSYFPSWIKTKNVASQDGKIVHYVVINNIETLIYLANQLCLTPHIWLSTIHHLNKPDRMVFDLDPSGSAKFQLVRWTAQKIKAIFDHSQLQSFVMSTGSRGLHVLVPINVEYDFDKVRTIAFHIAQEMEQEHPQYITLNTRKRERGDKIYLDVMRNGFGATTVAPYALRAHPNAPIATPLDWHELIRITPQKYTIKNIFRRIAKKGDPWRDIFQCDQSLKKVKI